MVVRKAILVVIAAAMIVVMFRFVVEAQADEAAEMMPYTAAAEVEALMPLSLSFIDGAMATLSKGWSGMSEVEREMFLQIYDPAGTGEVNEQFVVEVLDNYRKIRSSFDSDVQVVFAAQSDTCEGQRLYYTDLLQLYVCPHFFEEENELRKARTLIHEMTHIALLVSDRAYYRPTSKQYAELTPNGSWPGQLPLVGRVLREVLKSDTLYHPDAYAHYALINAGYSNIYAVEKL